MIRPRREVACEVAEELGVVAPAGVVARVAAEELGRVIPAGVAEELGLVVLSGLVVPARTTAFMSPP